MAVSQLAGNLSAGTEVDDWLPTFCIQRQWLFELEFDWLPVGRASIGFLPGDLSFLQRLFSNDAVSGQ